MNGYGTVIVRCNIDEQNEVKDKLVANGYAYTQSECQGIIEFLVYVTVNLRTNTVKPA